MHPRSPFTDLARSLVLWVALLHSGCLGGQSGGETGDHAKGDTPAACACVVDGSRPVRALVTALEGGCATLQVLEVLITPEANEYMPLEVGDVFGGQLRLSCSGSPEVVEGDQVLALFEPGAQTSSACPEYRACSTERCGSAEAAYTTTFDPECTAQKEKDPNVDCPPIEQVDEEALVAYDKCDAECFDETRATCVTHASEERLGGTVAVSKWVGDEVSFYWASAQRQESFAELASPDCQQRHRDLWNSRPKNTPSNSTQTQAPPANDGQTPALICPLKPTP